MQNLVKVTVITVFGVIVLGLFLRTAGASMIGSGVEPAPTPPRTNTKSNSMMGNMANMSNMSNMSNRASNVASNAMGNMAMPSMPANSAVPAPTGAPANPGAGGGKTIPKTFTLATDSQDENGEVAFNHENHAFMKYSPDGTSVMGCVECHHTDAPKSALKPPYVTSERDVVLTFDSWKASNQPVTRCRTCHFQDGNVPEGKEMPKTDKELNNRVAYHKNCNECHDAAAKLRPELKTQDRKSVV